MAATPYPQNLFHTGAATALTLDVDSTPEPTGDITLSVTGDASAQGWPSIPQGQKMVVTVGRNTQYEQKYLVSEVLSGSVSSNLKIFAEDRNYDGTVPRFCPAGTTVEHTVSATEMATINDHMRTKRAHGSDGDLVDTDSVQTLRNKSMSSSLAMGSNKITGVANGTATNDAVNWGQLSSVENIANTAQSTASTAQSTANAAQSTANGKVAKTGDTMTGALNTRTLTASYSGGTYRVVLESTSNGYSKVRFHGPTSYWISVDPGASNYLTIASINSSGTHLATIAGFSTSGVYCNVPLTVNSASTVNGKLTVNGNMVMSNNSGHAQFIIKQGGDSGWVVEQSSGDKRFYVGKVSGPSGFWITTGGEMVVPGNLWIDGQFHPDTVHFSDSETPNAGYSEHPEFRWLVYKNDGQLRRVSDATWRFLVAGVDTSSRRFKEQVVVADDAPDVARLKPVVYRWTEGSGNRQLYPGERFGLIAEDVAEVDKRLVKHDDKGAVLGLDTNAMIATLVEKVNDLEARLERLENG